MGLNNRKMLVEDSCSRLACGTAGKLSGKVCPPECVSKLSGKVCPPECVSKLSGKECPPECVSHRSHIFVIVFSSLAVVALLACGYFLYVKYFKTRRSSSQPQQPLPGEEMDHNHHLHHDHQEFIDQDRGPVIDHPIWYIRTVGLQESLINSITVCRYKKDDGLVEGTECAVCLNEFQEDETLRLLPKCDHAFHIPCIDTWLASHTNCPMCRAPIIKPTTAALPPSPPEPNVLDSSEPQEEIQLEILESRGEPSSGRVENGVYEIRTEAEEDIIDKQICVNDVVDTEEPRRRSVSMDSPSASKISLALSNVIVVESNGNSNISMGKLSERIENVPKKTEGNQKLSREKGTSSRGRSLQNGRQTIKKSSSCNGKLLLCMDIQNCDSVFPLRSF